MNNNTSEIAKLTERIARDPKSKLFVPLAEEYKKAGDIEMAIHVLTEGLKQNPGYVTARSILGRLLFEKGDYEGARKEFEEVIKAVPDNLIAQRRLGDVQALQNRPVEALVHYKLAVALTPRDEELASLVADLTAGIDIRPKLRKLTGAPVADQAAKPVVEAVASKPGSAPVAAKPSAVEAGAEPGIQVASAAQLSPESTQPDQPIKLEEQEEVAEEVLIVEPLDEEAPVLEAPETTRESPAELGGEISAFETAGTELVLEEPAGMPEATQPAELFAGEEIASAPIPEEKPLATEEKAPVAETEAAPPVSSDDFTTDTLAELYIAQGFFEKAIDIYERMLADRPDSRALKDKLVRVRAMAAGSETSEGQPVSEATRETAPEIVPSVAEEQVSSPREEAAEKVSAAEQEKSAAWINVEAREYIPPAAALEEEEAEDGVIEVNEEDILFTVPGASEPTQEPAPETTAEDEPEQIIEAELFTEPQESAEAGQETAPTSEPEPLSKPEPEKEETAPSFDIFAATSPASSPASGEVPAFEPREYIPPSAILRRDAEKPGEPAAKQHVPAGHQQAIDRLETWLRNIKKEK